MLPEPRFGSNRMEAFNTRTEKYAESQHATKPVSSRDHASEHTQKNGHACIKMNVIYMYLCCVSMASSLSDRPLGRPCKLAASIGGITRVLDQLEIPMS